MTQTMTTTKTAPDLAAAMQKIALIRAELSSRYIERDHIVDVLFAALLGRQHIALLGSPGEGKTGLTEAFADRMSCEHFYGSLHPFSQPEDLLGMFNPAEMMNGNYIRKRKGTLLTARVAVIDEAFKGHPGTLNSTLKPMNEREFTEEGVSGPIPLDVAILSSNEMPHKDNRGAYWDRVLYRVWAEALSDPGHRQFMQDERARRKARAAAADVRGASVSGKAGGGQYGTIITEAELNLLQVATLNVDVPDAIMDIWFAIREALYARKRYKVSTRRAGWMYDVLCASAVMNGRTVADIADLDMLQHVLWVEQNDIKDVRELVREFANPVANEMQGHLDKIVEAMDNALKVWNGPKGAKNAQGDIINKHVEMANARSTMIDLIQIMGKLYNREKTAGHNVSVLVKMIKDAQWRVGQITQMTEGAQSAQTNITF